MSPVPSARRAAGDPASALYWYPGDQAAESDDPTQGGSGGFVEQVLLPGRRDGRRGELDEDVGARGARLHPRVHVHLVRQPVTLAAVARRAGGDDVVPA